MNLGSPVNTSGDDGDIALSADGKTMILPRRNQPDGLGGVDLYVSHRGENGWSPLLNLGPRINTPGNDTCPWLGYDGKTLYFNSDWDGLVSGSRSKSSAIMLVHYSPGF